MNSQWLMAAAVAALATGTAARAQVPPWDIFDDTQSTSTCDVINSANAELVVLRETGQLTIITGRDVTLVDSSVNDAGDVFIGNDQFGFIAFATDGDGFRTLWWTSLTGNVIDIDGLTLDITETDTFPDDYRGVPCGVCESGLWDDVVDCDEPVLPPITVRVCGNDIVIAMMMSLGGLFAFGFPMRRRAK